MHLWRSEHSLHKLDKQSGQNQIGPIGRVYSQSSQMKACLVLRSEISDISFAYINNGYINAVFSLSLYYSTNHADF